MTSGGRTNQTVQDMAENNSPTLEALLAAGVHFGHQTRRWNPKMRRFIFAERNGIHIIDLQKTIRPLDLAQKLVRDVVLRGASVLFVCTKAQVAGMVKQDAARPGPVAVLCAKSRVASLPPGAEFIGLACSFVVKRLEPVERVRDGLLVGSEEVEAHSDQCVERNDP